ncbi:hypothetical protein [Streptomyces endophyticus]|uniref:Uncharacterized protein n=1 Tax=Streptomyces endophyticus TaxID=714166 RepID=A0ABU6FCN9_9ACTN|nr:hypothetical protein [Streptomyces endophyticus]MEB8341795.1 hypothetical protein [Streptomyces endophyticus]
MTDATPDDPLTLALVVLEPDDRARFSAELDMLTQACEARRAAGLSVADPADAARALATHHRASGDLTWVAWSATADRAATLSGSG